MPASAPRPTSVCGCCSRGGLHIHTTLRPAVQQHAAESALTTILPWEGGPSAAIVVIRNDTGHVEAMVGGRDFFGDTASARFNLATQGGRQAGSGFKPFVLAAALEQGIQMSALYPAPSEIELPIPGLQEPWEVSNFSATGAGGLMTLREALVRSINTVFAQLMEDVTPEAGVAMARRLGVASPLQPVLAAVLGSEDVTVLDMAAAYSTFARRGIYIPPTMVTRVIRLDGTVLFEHEPNSTRVLNSRIADEMSGVMTEVVAGGTGRRAAVEGRQVAGKTGTAENFVDAGFTGYTPQYTTAVWVGLPGCADPHGAAHDRTRRDRGLVPRGDLPTGDGRRPRGPAGGVLPHQRADDDHHAVPAGGGGAVGDRPAAGGGPATPSRRPTSTCGCRRSCGATWSPAPS